MKIGILGTRGIPNHYGGFEQFAEFLSLDLVKRGHEVVVYNSSNHPYKESTFQGVTLVQCADPEEKIGTAGQFIYDLNCILNSRKQNFDILLQLGYTSSSIWHPLLPKSKSCIVTNMDGLEWKRSKYSTKVQRFLKWAEKLGAKSSHVLVSDSIGIQNYLQETYNLSSTYIPYGAEAIAEPEQHLIAEFGVEKDQYNMLVARMEPENNIETILDGVAQSDSRMPFLVIGNYGNDFGQKMQQKFAAIANIKWIGGVYDMKKLDALRWNCNAYFHGHSVGGTNPSLLEAMASKAFIIANKNEFNHAILGEDAWYFENANDVATLLQALSNQLAFRAQAKQNNFQKIEEKYTWKQIVDQYEALFLKAVAK